MSQATGFFRFVKISYVRREGNQSTHILIQFVKQIDNYVTWIEQNPNIIKSNVAQDIPIYLLCNKVTIFSLKKKKKIQNIKKVIKPIDIWSKIHILCTPIC